MTMKNRQSSIGEEFHVSIKSLYNKEDDTPFIFLPSQKKVEIGEEITITVKHPNDHYDDFCEDLTKLIMKYQNGQF